MGAKATPGRKTRGQQAGWPSNTVTDLGAWRQRRHDQIAREAALDWLDWSGWCACWTTPGRRHRSRYQPVAPTGTGPA